MKIKMEVQMTVSIMYNYTLQHTYTSISGIFSVFLGILLLLGGWNISIEDGWNQTTIVIFLLGVMFVFGNPILLWWKARTQVKKTAMFKTPLLYELNEDGIVVRQGEEEAFMPWDAIMVVKATNMSIIVYFSRMRAFILPKAALGERYSDAVKLIYEKVPHNRVRIRTVS